MKLTKDQEREFETIFNEFISGDGQYLSDKNTCMYFYSKGLNSKFK